MNKVSIISVGDEICIGQIVNTNASWIAQRVTEIGYSVVYHSVVPDEESRIINEIDRILKFSDVVLITGGLGPTSDDLTKPSLAKYFNVELVFNEVAFEWIKEYFLKRGITEILERNKNLSYLPANCQPLHNAVGTAPGMLFKFDGKLVISMPGVPKEMKYIMNNSVIPLLQERISNKPIQIVVFRTLQTCGIAESQLAEKLKDLHFENSTYSLAFLPSYKGVRLRIGAKAGSFQDANSLIEKFQTQIHSLVGDYIYGIGEISLAEACGKLLLEQRMTIAVAESCTAGLLGAEFTKIPGSSGYFLGGVIAYSNEAKVNILRVSAQTIEKFGAVSKETVIEMAQNVKDLFGSTFGIAITGIAGPSGGTIEKPVGTVWIGIATDGSFFAEKYQFGIDREINRELSVGKALNLLYLNLKGLKQ